MRYFLFVFLVLAIAFSAASGGPAFSQRHNGYCDQADSTADTLKCVNNHNQDIQDKLIEAFKLALENQNDETRALLNESQKNWIIYRDAQCQWESELPEKDSLKRIYELSCLTEITQQRLSVLEKIISQTKQEEPREFGAQPRWMIALVSDHPEMFWRYGQTQSIDFDCDGANEQVMTGISVAHIQESVTIEQNDVHENAHQHVDIVIAVSDNPETGRPKSKLFTVPVTDGDEVSPRLCRHSIKLEPFARSQALEGENSGDSEQISENSPQFCENALHITDKMCDTLIIYRKENEYILEPYKVEGKTL